MKRILYRTALVGLLFFVAAETQAMSPKSSCVNYAHDKAIKSYSQEKWVTAYAYLVATEVCIVHSQFEDPREGKIYLEEIREARGEAWNQVHKKEGFSLTKPRLRSRPPR